MFYVITWSKPYFWTLQGITFDFWDYNRIQGKEKVLYIYYNGLFCFNHVYR